jgi:LacI family transcriptional regulator/LacI family repressor for deo operon, udp, cdd, tsx, nupC, and nupG
MTSKRSTITDVARHAGVSKATVSAVLNDSGAVRDATRERVLSAVELLNYRPPQLAGRGTPGRHRRIALLIKEHDNPYYAEIVAGVRAACDPRGYALLVMSSEGQGEAERRAVEVVHQMDVDGLIATPAMGDQADLSHFFELKRRNFPFVLLEAIRGVPASLIDVDNVEASRAAVEHLIALGHTRIVHVAGPAYSLHSEERMLGVRRAFSASRLAFHDADVLHAGAHLADGYRAALAYFGGPADGTRATAVACYNDLVAIGVCRALRELGLRVPGDVSVVGFDDIPLVEYLDVPLTTVRVPKAEMGARAADLLVRHIEAKQVLAPERVVLDAALVVRASTGPCPTAPAAPPVPPAPADERVVPAARRRATASSS